MSKSVICGCVLLLSMVPSLAAAENQPRVISVSGTASVYVPPDQVIVTLGVETTDKNLSEAKSANQKSAAKVVAAVKQAGVEGKDIQTRELEIEIEYDDRHNIAVNGYRARKIYAITLRDPGKLQPVLDAALDNGANRLMGVEYRSNELRKHRDEARKMAMKAAKEKATLLASEAGCKVGRASNISESGGFFYGGGYGRDNAFAQNAVQVNGGGPDSDESTPLGQIAIQASVQVTYELTD